MVPEPAGGITFVGRRATGMTSITLSWKQNSSFLVSRGRVASSSFSCWQFFELERDQVQSKKILREAVKAFSVHINVDAILITHALLLLPSFSLLHVQLLL